MSRETAGPASVDLQGYMLRLGREARACQGVLGQSSSQQRNAALVASAEAIETQRSQIIAANALDLRGARQAGLGAALLDRLELDQTRVEAICRSLIAIAELPDPLNAVMAAWSRPNGLRIERRRVPLGVIGIIYESRPNVTADAGALCLKSGNPSILRGGSESIASNRAIHACLATGLASAGLPGACIQLVEVTDRAAVGAMLAGLEGNIDVLVPRGGKSLVARVRAESRVPVIGHLEGICHVYVHVGANLDIARAIVLNSKMRRTGICGAAETLLIDRACVDTHLRPILDDLAAAGCEIRGDETVLASYPPARAATENDWRSEYLDAVIAVRVVEGLDAAIAHIREFGSAHTEAIVTDDRSAADAFLTRLDSAILLHNASTQFADGGEFGMGAEIGISTDRFHARGPVGVEQLTSYKYVVHGSGQIRP
ncbi:MAG: glutamate-5-semialdehyde dehydrogenase [Steroidobacteraceae bacterium]